MTFRADNPEVPTELRDLAQCFRSGRQAMSFSQERAHTIRCRDVPMYIRLSLQDNLCTYHHRYRPKPHDRDAT